MRATTDIKLDRINLRLQHQVKQVLERAAGFEGKTISNFILTSALAQAEKTIHEHEAMNLNRLDSEAFFDALAKPVRFSNTLASAFEEHEQRVTSK